jgi:hypothetical protein
MGKEINNKTERANTTDCNVTRLTDRPVLNTLMMGDK